MLPETPQPGIYASHTVRERRKSEHIASKRLHPLHRLRRQISRTRPYQRINRGSPLRPAVTRQRNFKDALILSANPKGVTPDMQGTGEIPVG